METIYGNYYADIAIISAIKAFGIDMRYFLEHKERRLKECIIVRGVACKLLYDERELTYQAIAELFGKKSHATIINAINETANMRRNDKKYKSKYENARKIFLNYLADSD